MTSFVCGTEKSMRRRAGPDSYDGESAAELQCQEKIGRDTEQLSRPSSWISHQAGTPHSSRNHCAPEEVDLERRFTPDPGKEKQEREQLNAPQVAAESEFVYHARPRSSSSPAPDARVVHKRHTSMVREATSSRKGNSAGQVRPQDAQQRHTDVKSSLQGGRD